MFHVKHCEIIYTKYSAELGGGVNVKREERHK